MKQEEQERYGAELKRIAVELQENLSIRSHRGHGISPDNAIGRLTRMEAIQSEHLAMETSRRMSDRLKQVNLALKLVSEGRYGRCTKCGAEIERGRIDAIPETRLCMSCMRRVLR